jgi:hypothetical protein
MKDFVVILSAVEQSETKSNLQRTGRSPRGQAFNPAENTVDRISRDPSTSLGMTGERL